MTEPVVGKTRHGELTLDQIVSLMPGLGRLMPDVGRRYWICWHAAKGGNWPLAAYQLRQLRHLLEIGMVTRPRYEKDLTAFLRGQVEPLLAAIGARGWEEFDRVYQESIRVIDHFHQKTDHPEIRWRLSPTPPEDFDLGPGAEA